jgi:hypothetical protein
MYVRRVRSLHRTSTAADDEGEPCVYFDLPVWEPWLFALPTESGSLHGTRGYRSGGDAIAARLVSLVRYPESG